MQARIEYAQVAPDGVKIMHAMERYLRECGLEQSLLHLVKVRASQMNGCAYCIDMHTKQARAHGESEQRLYTLMAWRETPFFSERERAALEWTEALTAVADTHVPDAVYERVRQHFGEQELVNLTLAITTINSWNRIVIAFRTVPGTYQLPSQPAHA